MPGSPSSSAQAAREALAARLRDLRLDAELTVRELAVRAGWSHSKVSRIETGRTAPSPQDLRAWAEACGVPGQAADLADAQRAVEGMWVDWRRMERAGLRAAQESVRPLYERTHRFRIYDGWLIHGLLQTPAYTTALLHSVRRRRGLPVDDVEAAVAERVARQQVLRSQRTFAFLLEEAVLHSGIGGPAAMREQLWHLLTAAVQPNVSLGIIPAQPDRSSMRPVEDFMIFGQEQVAVELVSGYLTITQLREIAMYEQVFHELGRLAVYGEAARALIRRAITTLG
ncbi:helix-turn-helix transcriptional regulator [Actinacidiphila sp. DG2A-62]|uniref:helix-turn-helix domain-containing protein n=1 Tax=Actinacidiphila sp. DG2A-62 TaxID=3108821 RepID=UPI002DBE37A9|nr:helix-turn-helix transcriptional regulator [Actinacidiphila sp. DG2A-62]MEC3994035.1 helix-turn-helix transcriptional regulator [Actinacidiphila sp. DG2A-62]